jgi:ABC-type amino acid transport substrate-binding protein
MSRRLLVTIAILLVGVLTASCGVYLWRLLSEVGSEQTNASSAPATATPENPTAAATSPCGGEPAQTGVLKRILARGHLNMGVQEDAPPMNYTTAEAGRTTRRGFDYDLASLIAAQLSLVGPDKVRVHEVDLYEKLFCLLKEKGGDPYTVDLIMSGITPDEMPDIDWSIPYYEFGYSLIAKKNSYITGLNDLRTKRVGVVKGDSAVESYVRSKLPNAEIVPLEDEDNWINAINLVTVDAIIYDFPFAVTEVRILNAEKKAGDMTDDYLEIKKPYLEGSDSKYSIGIPRGNPDLKRKIDEAIARLKENPKYAELVKNYFRSDDIRKVEIPADAKTYTVVSGDSLSRIAARRLGDASRWPELAQLNNVGNDYLIVPNQKLIMPADYQP